MSEGIKGPVGKKVPTPVEEGQGRRIMFDVTIPWSGTNKEATPCEKYKIRTVALVTVMGSILLVAAVLASCIPSSTSEAGSLLRAGRCTWPP